MPFIDPQPRHRQMAGLHFSDTPSRKPCDEISNAARIVDARWLGVFSVALNAINVLEDLVHRWILYPIRIESNNITKCHIVDLRGCEPTRSHQAGINVYEIETDDCPAVVAPAPISPEDDTPKSSFCIKPPKRNTTLIAAPISGAVASMSKSRASSSGLSRRSAIPTIARAAPIFPFGPSDLPIKIGSISWTCLKVKGRTIHSKEPSRIFSDCNRILRHLAK
jgi:hypothetical protein